MGFLRSWNETRTKSGNIRAIGALALLFFIPACSGSGSGQGTKNTVELVFKGRCVDAKGQGIPTFSMSVGRLPSATAAPSTVTVKTKNGQYETRVAIGVSAPATGHVLGSSNEKITIQVSASGYKKKNFTVTANQLFIGEPNTLNVTLERAA